MLENKRIFKLIAVLIVLVMSLCMLTGCGKEEDSEDSKKEGTVASENKDNEVEDYEKPIKYFIESMEEANPDKFIKAFPKLMQEEMKEIVTVDYLKEPLEEFEEEYGANIKLSYEIEGKTELDEEDVKAIQDDMNEAFESEVEITKGYEVEVKLNIKGDDGEDSSTDTLKVYQIDGDWYLIDF